MNPLASILSIDRIPHAWQVIATLLAVASLWTLCWWLSEKGKLDLAATGLSFYIVALLRQIGGSMSSRAPKEFQRTAGIFDTARAEFAAGMASRKVAESRADRQSVDYPRCPPFIAACVASPVLFKGIAASFKTAAEPSEPKGGRPMSTEHARHTAAEQITRDIADCLPTGTTVVHRLLVLAADELAREVTRTTTAEPGPDIWEDI